MLDENSGDELLSSTDSQSESESSESDISISEPSGSKRPRRTGIHSPEYFDVDGPAWTSIEQRQMLGALKDCGTSSIPALKSYIPTKTEIEIKEFVARKKKIGLRHLKEEPIKNEERAAPIDKWITQLCKIIPNDDYKMKYIARVLKYIALFEEREADKQKENGVNLKDIYLILSSLMSGEGPKFSNRETSYFLYAMFQNFAREIKGSNHQTERKVLSAQSFPTVVRCYGKKTKPVNRSGSLEDIVLNPLQVPKESLKK